MSNIRTKTKQYSLGIAINNQKRNLICRALTKTQFILHELVSQISLFWNYEKFILTYEKSKETEVWTPYFGSCVSHSMASSVFILKNDFID